MKATSIQDSNKSGTAAISITSSGGSNESLVIMATPSAGGSGNGPWALSTAAKDSTGNPMPGITITLSASEGSLSSNQGTTDQNGLFTATISPPSVYSGEAVAVSATDNNQTAAVDIVFVPYTFNPAIARTTKALLSRSATSNSNSTTLTTPFLFGTSDSTGTNIPWLTPNACFSNVSLNSTLPVDCHAILSGNGLAQLIPNAANMVCSTVDTVTNLAGAAGCVGVVATIVSCAASPTGIGAVICAGGLTYSGVLSSLCVGYITDVMAQFISQSKMDQAGMSLTVAGVEPDSPGISDAVGYVCKAVEAAAIGQGTGTQGVQIVITPSRTSAILGNTVQFTAQVSDGGGVNWSVNGVVDATGQFGTITSNGLYTAPISVPTPNDVSIAATSQSDPTASAPAVINVLPATPGTITTIVGNGIAGYAGDSGPAPSAELHNPTGVDLDGGGNLFIGDTSNNVVRRVDVGSNIITTIAGTGVAGYSGDGGLGTQAMLNGPVRATFDRDSNLYISDSNNERIRKVNSITDEITTIAGNGIAGYSGDGSAATQAELNFPNGEALDSDGNVFIADSLNNRIRKLTILSGIITTVAGNGVPGYSGDGGQATSAELNFPSRPFIDSQGNLYISDYQNNRVRKVDVATGNITTVAGTGVAGYSGDGGPASSAELNGPLSIVLDSRGVLYIADSNNERIRAVNLTSNPLIVLGITIEPGTIQTVVGNGQAGYFGDDSPAINAEVNSPTGLSVDSVGDLLFADKNNNVIRKVIGP